MQRHGALGKPEALSRRDHDHEAVPVGPRRHGLHHLAAVGLHGVQVRHAHAEQPATQAVVYPRHEALLVTALLRSRDDVGLAREPHEFWQVLRLVLGGDEDAHFRLCGGGGEAHRRFRIRAGKMPSWSRYLATVRRAIFTPRCPNSSTICWSVSGFFGSSSSTSFLICALMERALASSPVVVASPLEKKNFSGSRPRGVCTYFSFVTRLTVLSCMLMTSATSRRVRGFRYSTPFSKNSRCRSTMKFITLSIVWRRCSIAWMIQLALFSRWLMNSLFSPWNCFLSRAISW